MAFVKRDLVDELQENKIVTKRMNGIVQGVRRSLVQESTTFSFSLALLSHTLARPVKGGGLFVAEASPSHPQGQSAVAVAAAINI
jgi:hypothetical protein